MLNDTPPFKYKDLLLPENQNGFFNIAMKTQTFRHPEVRGHRVFWTRGKRRLHEHSWPFQLEWQSLAGLMQVTFPHAVLGLPGWALSALYTGREVVEKGKAGSCYWHVCISNNMDKKKKKKGLQSMFSHCWRIHVCCCIALLDSQTSVFTRPENHSPQPPFFCLSFVLFSS